MLTKKQFESRKFPDSMPLSPTDLFVLGQFLLKLQNFLSQKCNRPATTILVEKTKHFYDRNQQNERPNYLIEHDAILNVPRPVGVFERVERFHKVAVGRGAARNHQGATITCLKIVEKTTRNKTRHLPILLGGWTGDFIDRVLPPNESCRSRVSFESR